MLTIWTAATHIVFDLSNHAFQVLLELVHILVGSVAARIAFENTVFAVLLLKTNLTKPLLPGGVLVALNMTK